jgi:hypothetical protein
LRVQSFQFDAGVGGCELPICFSVMLVAVVLPCADLVGEAFLVVDAPIQALRGEHAEFGFGHVEPAAVLGRVMPSKSIGLWPALLFLGASGVNTTASMSARKHSHGTIRSMISSGSPFADSFVNRLSASKKLSLTHPYRINLYSGESHGSIRESIFRAALKQFLRAILFSLLWNLISIGTLSN